MSANFKPSSWLIFIALFALSSGSQNGPDGANLSASMEAKLCLSCPTTNFKPLEYEIDLKFQNGFSMIIGKADILIELAQSISRTDSSMFAKFLENIRKPVRNKIVLHLGDNLRISDARLSMAKSTNALKSGQEVEIRIKRIVREAQCRTIAFELERDFPSDGSLARLSIVFESKVPNPNMIISSHWSDTRGAKSEAPSHYLARLQGGQARNLFPCFDEPHQLARIRLRAHYSSARSFSLVTNLAKGENYYESKEAIPVSGLVLGFRIEPEREVEQLTIHSNGGVPVTISGLPRGSSGRSQDLFALDFASRCIDWLEASTKVSFPFERLELIGVPSTEHSGQIDGPGLGLLSGKLLEVTKDEQIAQDEATRTKQYELLAECALNVALAVARQWFGYAMRPDGWPNLWITEGIAFRAVLKMVDQLEPDLNLSQYVRSHHLKRALQLDMNGQCPPISHPGDYPAGANISPAPFNALRLVKAAAIIQMLEKTLAPDVNFDQAVGSLLRSGSKSSEGLSFQKLTAALTSDTHHADRIADLLKPWVELSGFPTLNISLDGNLEAISIRQQKSTRLNSEGKRVVRALSQWPLQMKFVFYSKSNTQFNELNLLHELLDLKRPRGSSATRVSLKLPDWLQRVLAAVELHDDYEVLNYYQADCSPGPVKCSFTIAQTS